MEEVTIYGLIDPVTHVVRYVGQAYDVEERFMSHLAESKVSEKPVYAWMRGLHPLKPVIVVLATVRPQQIEISPNVFNNSANIEESKWMKRFRRTILNVNRKQCRAYDLFVNPPLPWDVAG